MGILKNFFGTQFFKCNFLNIKFLEISTLKAISRQVSKIEGFKIAHSMPVLIISYPQNRTFYRKLMSNFLLHHFLRIQFISIFLQMFVLFYCLEYFFVVFNFFSYLSCTFYSIPFFF